METRGEEDHDVGLLTLVLDVRVRHLLCGTGEGDGAEQTGGGGREAELTWKDSGVTLCHTPKARRIARWVSFSPTLGVKLEILQETNREKMKVCSPQEHLWLRLHSPQLWLVRMLEGAWLRQTG